jgi:hypothetical protein
MIIINTPQPMLCDISGHELPITRMQRLEVVCEAAKALLASPNDDVEFYGELCAAHTALEAAVGLVE